MENKFILFDGAMGTMLQAKGLKAGAFPELLNITNAEIVRAVHRAYVEAGADVISANTFGANGYKLKDKNLREIIGAGIRIAREAGAKKVALDIGSLGAMLAPTGTLSFEEAYAYFAEVVRYGAEAGADLVLLETISDLLEMKCAVLAAKENCNLPIFATMTYSENGRTFLGTDPTTATITLCALGVDAVGINCSLGAKDIAPLIKEVCAHATCPVMVQPNAGLPKVENGKTVFSDDIETFISAMSEMVDYGATILGGCCGTNPDYIRALAEMIKDKKPITRELPKETAVTCATKTIFIGEKPKVIGERVNPTGKPKLKAALLNSDMDYILREAIQQELAGADILDVNVGLPGIDEKEMLVKVVKELQNTVNIPLQLDSSSPEALDAACRIYNGKPIINSVNCKEESLKNIIPIARKYGAVLVGLCLGEDMPKTADERFAYAKKLVNRLIAEGIKRENILIDCLVMTIATDKTQDKATINAVRKVKEELGVKTVLGVSNISFGMPDRVQINASFLSECLRAGLDAPILNPLVAEYALAFGGKLAPLDTEKYFTWSTENATDLKSMVLLGASGGIENAVEDALKTKTSLEIINEDFIPALNEIGEKFGKGEIFLPRLIASAEVVKRGMNALKPADDDTEKNPDIILATVKGDIHDIGKNIVKMLLQSYGFSVMDLGKDVPIEKVVEAAKKYDVKAVGLSALMTTTVSNMKDTIDALRREKIGAKIIVGGAVLTPEYANTIGADFYAKDARETVKLVQKTLNK